MEIEVYRAATHETTFRGLPLAPVPAGVPQEAAHEESELIDLNEYVAGSSENVYYIRVTGDSMIEFGIFEDDLLVVERDRQPRSGQVVIADINGSFTIKRFERREQRLFLVPANSNYAPVPIDYLDNFAVWGVVTHVIHKL
jgi:DNA polymerase V